MICPMEQLKRTFLLRKGGSSKNTQEMVKEGRRKCQKDVGQSQSGDSLKGFVLQCKGVARLHLMRRRDRQEELGNTEKLS